MEGVGVIEFFLTQVTLLTKGVRPVGCKSLHSRPGTPNRYLRGSYFSLSIKVMTIMDGGRPKTAPSCPGLLGQKEGRVAAGLQANGDTWRPTERLHLT